MRFRSRHYLAWIRRQPCCMTGCGVLGGEAHHIKGVGHFSGAGLTAPDILAMPMCREHHRYIQTATSRETLYWQYEFLWRTLKSAQDQGVITLNEHFYRPLVCMELRKNHNPAPVSEGTYSGVYRDWLAAVVTMAEDGALEISKLRRRA